MNCIKSFLINIDVFGVPFYFKYKSKDRFSTPLGGLFVLLFLFSALAMGIYYFIPFYNRKNFTTVHYTLGTPYAERVNFNQSKAAFGIGLNCLTARDGTTAEQLFDVKFKYTYSKLIDNYYNKTVSILGSHFCNKQDFYNEFNETFESSQIYKYRCLDNPSISIEGIWTSEIFSYLQIEVNAKNGSEELLDKIGDYLLENDCKVQLYYADNTIDIENYKDPINSHIETIFIQLDPNYSIRRNLYFMNEYLFDDDLLIWVFSDDHYSINQVLFSRYEEYTIFQGIKRNESYDDYSNYAKLYFRADTKKTEVKRKYQKVTEFYADASSLLITTYYILIMIFNFINKFYAEQALSKKIFFFQDFDHSLKINDKENKIRELIYVTDFHSSNNNIIIPKKSSFAEKTGKNMDLVEDSKIENPKPYRQTKKVKKKVKVKVVKKKIIKKGETPTNSEHNDNCSKYTGNVIISEYGINSKTNMKEKNKNKNNDIYTVTEYTDRNIYNATDDNDNISEIELGKDELTKNIEYGFSYFDKMISKLCKCCLTKELRIKAYLARQAERLLYNKLDIALYVRNMLLFDIMNETVINSETKDIINYLTRPIISYKHNEEEELSLFYNNYKKVDFDKFYEEAIQLSKKIDKRKEEIKLLSICNRHLKEMNI